MYLSTIEIKNFRSLKELRVDFQPGLNVLVGRNNTGKTNLLYAIRHALGTSASRGDALWLERDDFYKESAKDETERTISITLTFAGLSTEQRAHFYEIVDFNVEVAELIRQELDKWPTKTSGIAALSFTRVGGDEIRRAVGYELGHPHFVGTIDAFLFRYVIRPFLRSCFLNFANPRLVPGELGAENWNKYSPNQKTTVGKGINLFGCVFIAEDNGMAVLAHKPHPAQPLRPLNGDELSQVMAAKKRIWKKTGQLTHSDAALWASEVLEHPTFGPKVRAEIVQRFPLLIIDELQDTGYFLGKSISILLGEAAVRGVLVGDPDQAIYEFNGARPDLFNRFESIEGSVSLPLASSQRCPSAIATAAGHLKDSGGRIGPALDKSGRAFLVRYGNMATDIPRILDAIKVAKNGAVVKVLARQTSTTER